MKQRAIWLGWGTGLVLALAICAGCNKSAEATVNTTRDPGEPTQAQPKLRTMKIYIGPETMTAELALSPTEIQTGMMFRTNRLGENEGMLFALPYTQVASFWMKNCPVSLSAAYLDPEGVIREIHLLEANNTNSVVSATDNIRFVLETSEGWFERHHIQPGVAVATERGPLMDTFLPKR